MLVANVCPSRKLSSQESRRSIVDFHGQSMAPCVGIQKSTLLFKRAPCCSKEHLLKEYNQGIGEFSTTTYFNFQLQLVWLSDKLSQSLVVKTIACYIHSICGSVIQTVHSGYSFSAAWCWEPRSDGWLKQRLGSSESFLTHMSGNDAVCRLRNLQEFVAKHLYVVFSHSLRLFKTLWLGSKGTSPQRKRESHVEASCILHLVSEVTAQLLPYLGNLKLPLRYKSKEYRPYLSRRSVIHIVRRACGMR